MEAHRFHPLLPIELSLDFLQQVWIIGELHRIDRFALGLTAQVLGYVEAVIRHSLTLAVEARSGTKYAELCGWINLD